MSGNIALSLGRLKRLKVLNLSENFIGGQIPETFSNFTLLRILNLSSNQLTGNVPKSIATFPHLVLVLLDRNRSLRYDPAFLQLTDRFVRVQVDLPWDLVI